MSLLRPLVISIVISVVTYIIYQLFLSPLCRIPGPILAKLTDAYRLLDSYNGTTDATLRALHAKHGKYVRIGPSTISIADPAAIHTVYGTRLPVLPKSNFYSAGDTMAPDGKKMQTQFTTRDEAWHDYLVRPIKSAYALTNVLHFEPLVDGALSYLVSKLRTEHAITATPCPLDHLLRSYAWDVVGEVTFSRRLGVLDGDPAMNKLIRDGASAISYMSIVGQMPLLDPLLKNKFWSVGPPGFAFAAKFAGEQLRARMDAIAAGTYQRRGTGDFMDVYIAAEKDATAGGEAIDGRLTRRQISWLVINTVAGSDTTAHTLGAAAYFVSRNPAIQAKLAAELDEAAARNNGKLDFKTVHTLPYLDAVIKEALRLEPAIGMLLERVVPNEGLTLPDSTFIPGGTIIGINPRVINHNEGSYGANPHLFIPERWLPYPEESTDTYTARTSRMKDADLAFGHGRRSCIGKNLAIMEVYKTVARLFWEFEVEPVDSSKEWTVTNGWFVGHTGIDVYLKDRRKGNSNSA